VGQPVAEMVGESGREHLGFGFKTAEGARVDDAVAVALERVAVRVLRFRIAAAQAVLDGKTKAREHECGATVRATRPAR